MPSTDGERGSARHYCTASEISVGSFVTPGHREESEGAAEARLRPKVTEKATGRHNCTASWILGSLIT